LAKRKKKPGASSAAPTSTTSSQPGGKRTFSLADKVQLAALACTMAFFTLSPLIPSASPQRGTGLALVLCQFATLFIWAVAAAAGGRVRVYAGWTMWAVLALVAAHLLSATALIWGSSGNIRAAVNICWQWTGVGISFFLVRQLFRRQEEIRAAVSIMLGLAALMAVTGFYQFFVSMPATRAIYFADPDRAIAEAGIQAPAGSPARKLFESRLNSVEPVATFSLTNSLAGFLAPWLIVSCGVIAGLLQAPRRHWLAIVGAVFIAIAVASCLTLTKSRTAYLAAGAGIGLLILFGGWGGWRLDWKWPAAIAGVTMALALAGIFAGGLDMEVLSGAPKSVQFRLEYWRSTAAMIADHPLLGCGPGNFQSAYVAYKLPQASEEIADPHNFLLEAWATTGALGLLALLAVLFAFPLQLWSLQRKKEQVEPVGSDATALGADSSGSRGEESRGESHTTDASPFAISIFQLPGVLAIYIGGLAGVVLSYPIGMACGYPPDLAIFFAGLPVAAGVVALLQSWTIRGGLPLSVMVVAVLVLLANLLAAGGFNFTGVALGGWLLLGLAVNRKEADLPQQSKLGWQVHNAWPVAALAATLALSFYWLDYVPVSQSRAARISAREQQQIRPVIRQLEAAARHDRFSHEAQLHLTIAYAQQWINDGKPASLEQTDAAAAAALKLHPRSYTARKQLGDVFLLMYRRAGRLDEKIRDAVAASLLQRSCEHYEAAIARYPNNAMLHAQLAYALSLAGKKNAAARSASTAFQLDSQHNHKEKKLAQRRVYDPELPAKDANAEQIVNSLRNRSG